MNRLSSERASKPSNLLRERLDGFDVLSDDKRFIYPRLVCFLGTTRSHGPSHGFQKTDESSLSCHTTHTQLTTLQLLGTSTPSLPRSSRTRHSGNSSNKCPQHRDAAARDHTRLASRESTRTGLAGMCSVHTRPAGVAPPVVWLLHHRLNTARQAPFEELRSRRYRALGPTRRSIRARRVFFRATG